MDEQQLELCLKAHKLVVEADETCPGLVSISASWIQVTRKALFELEKRHVQYVQWKAYAGRRDYWEATITIEGVVFLCCGTAKQFMDDLSIDVTKETLSV